MFDSKLGERTFVSFAVCALALLTVGGPVAAATAGTHGEAPIDGDASALGLQEGDNASGDRAPLEDEYVVPAPEKGDPYYEAAAADGSWISYLNPRDEYRDPYLGDGSGKICVTLVNENGEVIAGESVPNTTVTIPTGETLEWHSQANPMTVRFPLTDHYDRPLDSDQFGTSSDLPQGDGYMDSHCIEFHGPDENATIEYGQAQVEGEHADWIEVVGYIQQANDSWDTDVDPIADARPYEEAGGWTYYPGGSHGQAVVVLQLDPPADAYDDPDTGDEVTAGDDENGTVGTSTETNETGTESPADQNETGADTADGNGDATAGGNGDDTLPGFGALAALVGLTVGALARMRR